jgi:hypothetical protein
VIEPRRDRAQGLLPVLRRQRQVGVVPRIVFDSDGNGVRCEQCVDLCSGATGHRRIEIGRGEP